MVGMIIKFEDLSENILKKFFEDIDYSNIDFLVKYWESYGDDFENMEFISSYDFKEKVLKSEKCFPEFCELLVRDYNKKDEEVNYYSEFLISDYFLSISIIDRRNIEICFKTNEIVSKICQNIINIKRKGKHIIEIDEIDLNANLLCWRQENGIY